MAVSRGSRHFLLALMCGLLLVAAPLAVLAEEDYEEYYDEEGDDDYGDDEGGMDEKDVVVLTDKTFDGVISKTKFALVEFYAPWCGHCKNLAPEYAKAATTLKAYDDKIVIAKVDATEEKALAEKFEVQGFPTLKWFVDGEPMEYGGGRDEKTIVSWVKKKTGPPAATASSKAELEKATSGADVTVVGYFKEFKGKAFDTFIAYATKTDSLTFVQTTSSEVASAMSLSAPGVAVKKSYSFEEESIAASEGELASEEALKAFVSSKKMPLFVPFSQENADLIFESGIEEQVMFIADTDVLDGDAFKPFKTVATEFAGKLVFVTVNVDEKSAAPVTEFFGISDDDEKPVIMGFSIGGSGGKKFKLPGAYSLESLRTFAQAMFDKTATPDYKSAPIPENSKDGDVTVVVGKTVDEIVKDEKRDVLLEVYAPWCGHCKNLAPIYKKLAKRFKKIDSVVIAKMDGTENEHADVDVQGYPTLIFFPAGGKDPVPMDGERTLAGMTKFIKQHATVPYELPKKKTAEEGDETDHTEL